MVITATELKANMGKYLTMAAHQDIFITKNGKNIAKLTNPAVDKLAVLDSLAGIAAMDDETVDEDEIKAKRLERQ